MKRLIPALIAAAFVAIGGMLWFGAPARDGPPPGGVPPLPAPSAQTADNDESGSAGKPGTTDPQLGTLGPDIATLIVRDVTVRDVDGRVAWRGTVDLAPAVARIEAGESDPHPNDGGIFSNRERLLPAHERGYYREYVVRTPGISHAGPQRLVIGRSGEVYYTMDHYASFLRIR